VDRKTNIIYYFVRIAVTMLKINQCPNCLYEIDLSENFCGNCGHPLKKNLVMPQILPEYATIKIKPKINKAIYVCIISIFVAIVSGLILSPIYIILFAFLALVSATFISYQHYPKIKIASLSISGLLIIACIGLIVFETRKTSINQINTSSPVVRQSSISTSCYSFQFQQIVNFTNPTNTCSIEAYNGSTISTSTKIIKIYAINNQTINSQNFINQASTDLKNNLKKLNLPIKIITFKPTFFSNDLADKVEFSYHQTLAIMEFIYHPSQIDNIFLIFYGQNQLNDNMKISHILKNWQWKNY